MKKTFIGIFALLAVTISATVLIQHEARTRGEVESFQRISDTEGEFSATIDNEDLFGFEPINLGDLDGDGIEDIAVGAIWDDDGGTDYGAVYILFMNQDATVKSFQKISSTTGGFGGTLEEDGQFGIKIENVGDMDDDGVVDIAVGERAKDDGGTNRGAVWTLFLNTNGTVKDEYKISSTSGDIPGELDDLDLFGRCVVNMGDLNGDDVNDYAVCAFQDDDGGTDRGAFYLLYMNDDGSVDSYLKYSDTSLLMPAGFSLEDGDKFGTDVARLNDLDGDGVDDWAIGTTLDDDGGTDRGAIYIFFMNNDETVKDFQKISESEGNFSGFLADADRFGHTVTAAGDLNDDGVDDVISGAWLDDDAAVNAGALYILFLESDGTVQDVTKITEGQSGFEGDLDTLDFFGLEAGVLADYNGDGQPEIGVSSPWDNDGGTDRGSFWILFLDVIRVSSPFPTPRNISVGINGSNGLSETPTCTTDRTIDIALSGDSVKDYLIGTDKLFVGAQWQPIGDSGAQTVSWELPDEYGTHTLYIKFRSMSRNQSNVIRKHIEYAPTCP